MEKNDQSKSSFGAGQKITPFLWFNNNIAEALELYKSVFKNVTVTGVQRANNKIMSATFEIEGQKFMALDGGPHYSFTPAISFFVSCKTQEEVDEYWDKLSKGGSEDRCGWLKDKFGLSWQIIPDALGEMLYDPNPVKSKNVLDAMLQMKKIDVAKLKEAYNKE